MLAAFIIGAPSASLWLVLTAAAFIALVGAVDDLRPIAVGPRLLLQAIAAIAILAALPAELRVVPALPWWFERSLLLVGVLWLVNLTNFMDGLDWMTIAGVGPLLAALTIVGLCGGLPVQATIIAAALGGALIGFAPFNRPVARLFLGDVGSLPIGLLVGWLLMMLASQHFAAALLLPLYYLTDATLTLFRRIARGEPFWVAHRSHFYQRATDNGLSVLAVTGHVLALNILLCALAAASILLRSWQADVLLLMLGAAAVAFVLLKFSKPK
jgi:UDP-N-acetylmuramyl pentapeptide phosphotransferase/UDP-N-acetylglucosamine-1-phosphate transferase